MTVIDYKVDPAKMNNMSAAFRDGSKQLEEVSQALVKIAETMEKGAFEGNTARAMIDALKSVGAKNTLGLSQKLVDLAKNLDEVVVLHNRAMRENMANIRS